MPAGRFRHDRPSLPVSRAIAIGLVHLAAAILLSACAGAQDADSVWVNTRSGVYHCRGTQSFGRTSRGTYLPEREARRRGYRASGGRACTADAPGAPAPALPMRSDADTTSPASGAGGAPATAVEECTVTRLVDGDTLECAPAGRIRLTGIDAPERSQGPHHKAVMTAMARMLPVGSRVRLEGDREPRDRYRRRLAYIWHGGEMVNRRLVREGWALSVRFPPNVRHAASLDSAERLAREERRGLWAVDGFACRPQEHRRRRC